MIQIMGDPSLAVENKRLLEILAEKDKRLAELEELTKCDDKFWITDAGKQRHTSGLPPDMVLMMETMDRIIGDDETFYTASQGRIRGDSCQGADGVDLNSRSTGFAGVNSRRLLPGSIKS